VFYKTTSGQYEDENIYNDLFNISDTKMNKEVTVCSSKMLLTTKDDYIKLCLNEISKAQQDFLKFKNRYEKYNDEYMINHIVNNALDELNQLSEKTRYIEQNVSNTDNTTAENITTSDNVDNDTGNTTVESITPDNNDGPDNTTNESMTMFNEQNEEIKDDFKKKIDDIRKEVAKLHSLIDFNENISDAFLEYALSFPGKKTMMDKIKNCFKTNVPISKQFTHFGNYSVNAWMEWKNDKSAINKYLKENINSLKERKNKIEYDIKTAKEEGKFTQFVVFFE
jgi:hypothetical protein